MSQLLQDSKKQKKRSINSANKALRYTSIATEMLVIIFIGVFGGIKMDFWLNTSPLFSIIFSLTGVFAGIYLAIKDFIRINEKEK